MDEDKKTVVIRERVVDTAGYVLGSVIAAICSWTVNKSIVWACVHFFFGWLYVFYAACVHTDRLDRAAHEVIERR